MGPKLILYSDFCPGVSDPVDSCFLDFLTGTKGRVCYIPSESDDKRTYFRRITSRFSEIGIHDLFYFDLGVEYKKEFLKEMFACDAVYLSGGDPSAFMRNIALRNFGPQLLAYLQTGKPVVGVSAGAMILTKSFLIDVNQVRQRKSGQISQHKGLGFLNFEFIPHKDETEFPIDAFAAYAQRQKCDVYLSDDSGGLVIQSNVIKEVGGIQKFSPSK